MELERCSRFPLGPKGYIGGSHVGRQCDLSSTLVETGHVATMDGMQMGPSDSMWNILVLSEGRCSDLRLLTLRPRKAALCISGKLCFRRRWLDAELNLADKPSPAYYHLLLSQGPAYSWSAS